MSEKNGTNQIPDIAIIGDRDSILIAKAVGIGVYPETDGVKASKLIHELAKGGCKVIFITEQVYPLCVDAVSKYKTEAYPSIIPIPSGGKSTGASMAQVVENVEKAIGQNILF